MKYLSVVTDFFTKGNARTLRAKKNISVSFVTKGISILISFLIVPLTLNYVSKAEYGIWMTIAVIIQWFAYFDIGLGNGLRNKLAEALAKNETEKARIYISSAFALIAGIAILMFLGFLAAANYISWNAALNTDMVPNEELFKIVTVVFFFFCLGFVFKLVSSILRARQQYAIDNIIDVSAQFLGLIAIFILVNYAESSLFNLCLVYGGKSAVVLLIASVVLFSGPLKAYRPSLKYVNLKEAFPLLNLGIKFFAAQILYLIISRSSVILVAQFFGPEDVTVFNLAVRYMTIMAMAYIMVLTPFLTAFTEAYTKKEYGWIRDTVKKINMAWLLCSLGTITLIFFADLFFQMWVGDIITIPVSLIVVLAVSSIIETWGSTYTLFLNAVGIIRLQLYVRAFQALALIPLSYLFYRMGLGLASIVVAQIILYLINAVLFTFQYYKLINHRARGIWAK